MTPAEERVEALSHENDETCRKFVDMPWTPSQSPIETAFAWALAEVFDEFGGGQYMKNDPLTLSDIECEHGYGHNMSTFHAYVWNQVKIGKYTADFAVSYRPGRGRNIRFLVIECDGHEFHERTKKQAEHDKRRDREMQEMGIPVLRITGSEIWRSPTKAAFSVITSAVKALQVTHG